MRAFVLGPGAVGRYLAAALAGAGIDVVLAARGSAQALRECGIQVAGPRGDVHLRDVQVCSGPGEATGQFDIGVSCVKLYDAEASARTWQPVLARCAAVVSLQNGIDGPERIAAGAGLPRVYGGLVFVSAVLDGNVVRYQSDMSSITFGGPGAPGEPALLALHRRLGQSDAPIRVAANLVDDVKSAQWRKHAGLATNAALTCLVRQPAGVVYHDQDILPLAVQSIAEIVAVGRAEGAVIPSDHEAATLQLLQGFPAGMYASMYHDLASGRPLELDGLIGAVVRLGRHHDLPTPFHALAYACLKPYAGGKSATAG